MTTAMGAFIVYIIKSSLLLAMLVSLFMLFMSRETFHKLNRYLLLLIIVVSLVLPFANVGVSTPLQGVFDSIENGFAKTDDAFPVADVLLADELPEMATQPKVVTFDAMAMADAAHVLTEEKGGAQPVWYIVLLAIYGLGVALLVIRQLVMYIQVLRLIMRSCKVSAAQYCAADTLQLRIIRRNTWIYITNCLITSSATPKPYIANSTIYHTGCAPPFSSVRTCAASAIAIASNVTTFG